MARLDPHSYSDSDQPQVGRLDWTARVDFDGRTLQAQAILTLKRPGAGPLDLDTRGLFIDQVSDLDGRPLPFELFPDEPILGSRLRIDLPPDTLAVRIGYRTAASASAVAGRASRVA